MKKPETELNFTDIKRFLETGTVDSAKDLGDVSLRDAVAGALRHIARQEEHTEPVSDLPNELREKSRNLRRTSIDALQSLTEVDLQTLNYVITTEKLDTSLITRYLQDRGVTQLPILSDAPSKVVELFRNAGFTLQVIPHDQVGLTDFGDIKSHPRVPDWFRESQDRSAAKEDQKTVDIGKALKERWFLIFTILLGLIAAAGFSLDLGLEIPDILNQFDLFLSFYGMVAVTRATVQIRRAERWNSAVRQDIRSNYSDAFTRLLHNHYDSLEGTDPSELKKLTDHGSKITGRSIPWDRFKDQFGFESKSGSKRKSSKPSLLDQYKQASGDQELTPSQFTDALAAEVIAENFPEGAPSVAVVIPTYQTSKEEMVRLLDSIKDQAYPVNNAYVVYNDDPNDRAHAGRKQIEFLELDEIVREANAKPNRANNPCKIHLLAQGARGKREAMAMGMAMGLGSSYFDDLKAKHGANIRRANPRISEEELDEKIATSIANLDLRALPNFRHDVILNIDSDTEILDSLSVLNSALLMKDRPDAACTTGDVRVVNRNVNLLSEMTYQRYWRAFFVERAAQAPEVSCMSGPWVFMRSEALASILDEWYYQEFLGERCTYGDDRNLSTLFLQNGWESLFCPDSAVLTDCPTDWKTFIKQQLRWNKSFNRENFILFTFIQKLSKYVQFDVSYQQTFPFAMLYILASISLRGLNIAGEQGPIAGAQSVMPYIVSVLLYNEIFFGAYGAVKNRDPKYLLSPVYIDYHFGALLWLKIRAFFDMTNTSWGTKGETEITDQDLDALEAQMDALILDLKGTTVSEVQKGATNQG